MRPKVPYTATDCSPQRHYIIRRPRCCVFKGMACPNRTPMKGKIEMSTKTLVRVALPLLACGVCLTGAQAAPAAKALLSGSSPKWATAENLVSSTDSSTDVGFRVYLGWTDPAGAAALAAAVSDPANAAYGHYLSPAQFRKQFAPAANNVAQVQNWLRAQGFTLTYTPKNGH